MTPRAPRARRAPAPGRGRSVVVAAAAVAGAALVTAWLLRDGAPRVPPSDVPESVADRPPDPVEPPRTEAERLQRVIEILVSGDHDSAEWAHVVLSRAGEPARAAVAETARRCLHSNQAFVEHALDVLVRAPRPEDAALAVEALSSADPEVVKRACILLGRLGTPEARSAMRRLGDTAAESWPLPVFALDAIVALGGDEAVSEIERVATSPEILEGVRDQALSRIGKLGGARARAIALREFERASTDDRRIAAAEALVEMRDPAPLPVLREMYRLQRDERALTLLARAGDPVAIAEIAARLRATLESDERLAQAVALARSMPPDAGTPLLREATRPSLVRDVRAEAWAELARRSPEAREDVLRMLRADGPGGREERIVAALVLGQIRDPSTGEALRIAAAANAGDSEVRIMVLRAILLAGDPGGAETVVRAMADDPTDHAAPESVSFEIANLVGETSRALRSAMAPFLAEAIRGKLGRPGPGARARIVTAASASCGPEVAPLLEPLLTDGDRHVREAAAEALVWVSGPGTEAALRNAWWHRQDDSTRSAIRRALVRVPLVEPVR